MSSRVQLTTQKGLIHPPKWLPANVHYEVITGSTAYAVSSDTSDMDIYGFCIPPKEQIFPHLKGEIPGFGAQLQRFEQFQQHHVKDGEQEYDFTIYSIVKYFQLCMENNPNMVDTLFVPQRCVLFCSKIGQLVRDNRKLFLHKGSYHKFRGYMFAQMHKVKIGSNSSNPKRAADIEKYGYDPKFLYHVIRLGLECEQILTEHDLDLEKNKEILKSIRRGEWNIERVEEWANVKERHLDELYITSTLQHKPDEDSIKRVLLQCLEEHYGSLKEAIVLEVPVDKMIRELKSVIEKYEK